MLSKKAKYGLKAIIYLAKQEPDRYFQISEIADEEHIPQKFLEAILLELKKNTILFSLRGKNGGYKLAKSPAEISVGSVIRMIDGPLAMIPCVSKLYYQRCEECIDEKTCEIRHIMQEVRDATTNILDNTSLEVLIHGSATDTLIL